MLAGGSQFTSICSSCFRRQLYNHGSLPSNGRSFSISSILPQQADATPEDNARRSVTTRSEKAPEEEKGRLSERLEQMTEESLEQAGRRAGKTVEEAGFSEELKRRLEAKIDAANFRNANPAAFAQVSMPSSAGKGTQMAANAQPWTGQEPLGDAALRMLDDAHKPLRGTRSPRIPQPRTAIDTRMKKPARKSQGERLANARDRTSKYAMSQDPDLPEREKEQYRRELKERFTAGARPMPATVQGLQALANERIEDAIARGQFKNIPRGKGTNTEKDHNANSPFLDTTEYFMNKIIKKQDIVPPWIEKQQELVKTANVFRLRLRNDWKRHAARTIASKGGSLESQVQRAGAYAAAEAANNPRKPKVEAISGFDAEGKLSQVTMTETASPVADTSLEVSISVSEDPAEEAPSMSLDPAQEAPLRPSPTPTMTSMNLFRDPDWEAMERSYHALSITNLNNLARSYNLQAPDLAKKPYYSLDRELRACFADVAPQLADEIQERARRPAKIRMEVIGHTPGGVLEKFGGEKVAVYDERKPQYGFKQFWKDLWRREGGTADA